MQPLCICSVLVLLASLSDAANYYGGPSGRPSKGDVEPVFSWKQISYVDAENTPITENFIQYNNVPMGATLWRNRLFITMPRRRDGIPSTLNYINVDTQPNTEVPLIPYPDLKTNALQPIQKSPVNLVSVYRTTADSCNRLWMVDTGRLEYPGNEQQVQPSAIIIFDLLTNQFIHRYELKDTDVSSLTTLASITVDINGKNCDDAYAYMPDLGGYSIVVYSLKNQQSWKFSHNYFHQDPIGGDFAINGLRFQWEDGIFSITLSPKKANGFRTAYFHAMASTHEFSVSTEILRNPANANRTYHGTDFVHLGDKGPGQQTSTGVLDQTTGVMFYSQVNMNALACWNTKKPFSQKNHVILLEDEDRFIYPSDATVDTDGNLWMMTNSMPIFQYGNLDPSVVNFRVWKFNIKNLIAGTKCDTR